MTPSRPNLVVLAAPAGPMVLSGFVTSVWLYAYLSARALSWLLSLYARILGGTVRYMRTKEYPMTSAWLAFAPVYCVLAGLGMLVWRIMY